jgi:hypothetical protein
MLETEDGRPSGRAVVKFSNSSAADAAEKRFQGLVCGGRILKADRGRLASTDGSAGRGGR